MMDMDAKYDYGRRLAALCRGDSARILPWLDERDPRWLAVCCATIVAGCGLYGFAAGLWRAPLQAVYTGVKMPLLIFLTCGANGLLNGLLAQVLGSGLSFRQTSLAVLMSFTIAALILAALSPVVLFICYNVPAYGSTRSALGHNITLLSNVVFIAYAGVAANRNLFGLLRSRCGNARVAAAVLFFWLAGNLFLGAQFSWLLRPFFGSAKPPVQFLSEHPTEGNFYEALFHSVTHINE